MKCKIRTWVHRYPEVNWGHYDLYVAGPITLMGSTVSDVVFSYQSDGQLYSYPESKVGQNYPANVWSGYEAWEYEFDANNAQKNAFVSNLTSQIHSVNVIRNQSTGEVIRIICTMKDAVADYSLEENNSFKAVAYWCKWLGYSVLYDIYQNAHNTAYLKYIPVRMLERFSNNWIPINKDGTPVQ